MNHYNLNIQLSNDIINDIFTEFKPDTKMLVFGLGYDSKMWYEGTNKNTFFVENNDVYIELNKNDISSDNIIKYYYNTKCSLSDKLKDNEINEFIIPEMIVKQAPFDIILIDGPEGYSGEKPGRLIPCYWSLMLSKPGTLIYVDDANRPLEQYCIEKFYKEYSKRLINNRCMKIKI
jgi:hypothetical protein